MPVVDTPDSTHVVSKIEPVRLEHEAGWRALWAQYCDGAVQTLITDATWRRILDPQSKTGGIVATMASEVIGFVTFVEHDCTWELGPVCYVEDLFVAKAHRGRKLGVGVAMAEHLVARLNTGEWTRLYGITRAGNDVAQALYNQFAQGQDYKRYVIKPPASVK